MALRARWQSLAFPATDHIKGELVAFNVHRNKIRISANVVFAKGFVFIRKGMTHDDYQQATKRRTL